MKKRFLAIAMAAVLAVSALGCGAQDSSKKDTSTKANKEETTSTNETDTKDGSKVYTIATDTTFAPFEFQNADGDYVGIDMDILEAVAKDQGFEYEVNAVGFDAALLAVEVGQADGVIAGMSITEERKNKFDFSDSYYSADVCMAVAEDSDITKYEDLKGKNVAIKTGTNGADFANSIKDEYGFTTTEFADSSNMYQDVQVGNSVACFEDYPVMAYAVQQGLNIKITDYREAGSDYGFAVSKGENAELLKMFNEGLANIKANGKFDEIVDKYTKK
ncbi:amino acid ABC transporter substrate-binding protein, PAAT family [Acetitomaculum ruminis DSM 5522]|uniref:Amino acid ABC transporter substrate-binding protein, PAAT family n=1 Tax=Acetitomaculum ruminis DSM 5522 TaxID=1120918 RepID=A0A1I0XZS0_9FIRM|nr:transporter substrate-binding domain-containing protein [Acetitomaculum ruminis]SFB06127.1 amino acid ABC transporter substrate-binding protein, PAAT family [Acetitomaculum ruminis DSM 5522]